MFITRVKRRRQVRGLAPLEMAMAVPVIVILFAVIFAMGRVGVMQTDAVIRARHRAWAMRHSSLSYEVLELSSQGSVMGTYNAIHDKSLGRYLYFSPDGSGTHRGLQNAQTYWHFTVPPLLRPIEPRGSATHHVFCHTWDHRTVDLEGSFLQNMLGPAAILFPNPTLHVQSAALFAPGIPSFYSIFSR